MFRPPPRAMPRAILVAGATASGKSALALELASAHAGVIINADASQVYGDLAIITARPGADELARAPHALYGHVDAAESYSVGRWLADLGPLIEQAGSEGLTPIIVGGTGLYFKALTEGLVAIPAIPDEVRRAMRDEAASRSAPELHADLARRDPETAARLAPSDRQRILRALEVLSATGRPLVEWQRQPATPLIDISCCRCIIVARDRDFLHARIDARFDAMMREGALEEVRALADRRLDPALPAMRALGVPALLRHLAGSASLAEAVERAKLDTRQYVKRQETWARKHMAGWEIVSSAG